MAKSNGFCHTFGGSPYGRLPQPPKVRVAIWAGFTIYFCRQYPKLKPLKTQL